jgi:hypothetical protein
MKKIFIATILAVTAITASALELGVNVGRDFSDVNRNYGEVALSHSVGPVSAGVEYRRSSVGANDQNRYTLTGGYDLAKVGSVQFTPTVGVSYLDNKTSVDGYAMNVGLEVSTPLVGRLDGVVGMSYQFGQSRVNTFNGVNLSTGVRYKF